MKSLITAALLLALAFPAFAENRVCTGRVHVDVVTDNGGLLAKGDKVIGVGNCTILDERVLRTCPKGSFCRVEGTPGADEALDVVSVKKVRPYQETADDFVGLWDECVFRMAPLKEDGTPFEENEAASCKVALKLQKKLEAHGYCAIAKVGLGRLGKDGICYPIK